MKVSLVARLPIINSTTLERDDIVLHDLHTSLHYTVLTHELGRRVSQLNHKPDSPGCDRAELSESDLDGTSSNQLKSSIVSRLKSSQYILHPMQNATLLVTLSQITKKRKKSFSHILALHVP